MLMLSLVTHAFYRGCSYLNWRFVSYIEMERRAWLSQDVCLWLRLVGICFTTCSGGAFRCAHEPGGSVG